MDLKPLYQTIGQSIYQSINQEWLDAKIVFDHATNTATGSFQPSDDTLAAIDITVNDNCRQALSDLFDHAMHMAPEERWDRAIFSITRKGDFNINFEQDVDEEVIVKQ